MAGAHVRVAAGDQVAAGDTVGLTGNSRNTTEPHIHIHIHIHAQNRPEHDPQEAIGLPLCFSGYLADGEPVADGVPVRGQFVANE